MRTIVCVTHELWPFTDGEYGKIIDNILTSRPQNNDYKIIVITLNIQYSELYVVSRYPEIEFIKIFDAGTIDNNANPEINSHKPRKISLPSWSYTDTIWHWRSILVLKTLEKLVSRGHNVVSVEFPDIGGLGFCTIQERLFKGFISNSRISVRKSYLNDKNWRDEHQFLDYDKLCVADLEDKCRRDCDFLLNPDQSLINFDYMSHTRIKIYEAGRNPLVSIIVPHFNMFEYLYDCLENISKQSYKNIEVIIIDDFSNNARDLLSRYTSSFPLIQNLRIIYNEFNHGLAKSRNIGISHANGDYILTLDCDDILHPEFIELSVKALIRHSEFSFVVPQAGVFMASPGISADIFDIDIIDYTVFLGEARYSGAVSNRYSTATALFDKKIFNNFIYNEKINLYEDWNLYYSIVNNGYRCIITNDVYFLYRQRENSMINKHRSVEEETRHRISIFNPIKDGYLNIDQLNIVYRYLVGRDCRLSAHDKAILDHKKKRILSQAANHDKDINDLEYEHDDNQDLYAAIHSENMNLNNEIASMKKIMYAIICKFDRHRNINRFFRKNKFRHSIDVADVLDLSPAEKILHPNATNIIRIRGWIAMAKATVSISECILVARNEYKLLSLELLKKIPRDDVCIKLSIEGEKVYGFDHSMFIDVNDEVNISLSIYIFDKYNVVDLIKIF